jgi:hypothetical protein
MSTTIEPRCSGIGCPKKNSCYHYTSDHAELVSGIYWANVPYNHVKNKCEFYFGHNQNALLDSIKDILNGKVKNDNNTRA